VSVLLACAAIAVAATAVVAQKSDSLSGTWN
jgi:hypothetical protein